MNSSAATDRRVLIICIKYRFVSLRRPRRSRASRGDATERLAHRAMFASHPRDAVQLPPSALTRLLGPAYDALDNDEPERALKHLKKARAQFPRLHLARALEALAVCRIDPSANRATALEMADSIRAETQRGDVTENVAHVLLLLFEETADVSRKLDLLESIARLDATNMQTFRELYVEYGMCWEFEKQRSAAMRAYKATGDEKELLRAVAAMLARRDEIVCGHSTGMGNSDADAGSMGPEPLLKLANGMLAKLYQKGGIESYDSFMMYAKTLLLLRRGDEAYAVATSAVAEKCVPMPIELERFRASCALASGQFDVARAHHEKVLHLAPDDWDSMNAVLNLCCDDLREEYLSEELNGLEVSVSSQKHRHTYVPRVRTEFPNINVEKASEFVQALVATADANGGERAVGRGAYLLKVELANRVLRQGDRATRERALAEAIAEYHDRFGTWNSCAQDMRMYARAVKRSVDARRWLIKTLRARGDADVPMMDDLADDAKKELLAEIRKKTSALMICADLNEFCSSWHTNGDETPMPSGGREAAKRFMADYSKYKPLVDGGDPRDQTPIDVYAHLASLALVGEAEVYKEKGDDENAVFALLAAAAALTVALTHSPHNASLIFSLTAIYRLVGAPTKSLDVLRQVDMKNVQMATLLHHATPAIAGGAKRALGEKFLAPTGLLRELQVQFAQIAQSAVGAGLRGRYTKVLEFADFYRTLRRARAIAEGETLAAWTSTSTSAFDSPETLVSALEVFFDGTSIDITAKNAVSNSRWDVDDENMDEFTYLDDFNSNPMWLKPCADDPANATGEWWSNPISVPSSESSEWYFRGARNALRRRMLFINGLRLRSIENSNEDSVEVQKVKEALDFDMARTADIFTARFEELKTSMKRAASPRATSHAELTHAMDHALIAAVVGMDAASRADVKRAYENLCEAPLRALESNGLTDIFARGRVASIAQARAYAEIIRAVGVATKVEDGSVDVSSTATRLADACAKKVERVDFDELETRARAWWGDADEHVVSASFTDVARALRESITDALSPTRGA